MSPEIICEPHEYGIEVDMWSLGIVAFELLLGHTPFRGQVHKLVSYISPFEIWLDMATNLMTNEMLPSQKAMFEKPMFI